MKILFAITISLCCLSSCTQQEEGMPHALEVWAEIAPPATTRTTANNVGVSDYDKLTFDSSDEILIQKNSDQAVKYKKGTNTWIPTSNDLTTTDNNDKFTASYPTVFTEILEAQNTYAGFWKSKKLTAAGGRNGNKVTFSFTPAAAKISVVVSYSNVQSSAIAQVTGTAIRGGSGSQIIKLLQTDASGNGKRYSFAGIIAPGSRTYKITLKATDGEKSYDQSAPLTMKAGYNYQYTFTSTNELILTGVTVLPFNAAVEEDGGSAT